jgi:hypothetical protein
MQNECKMMISYFCYYDYYHHNSFLYNSTLPIESTLLLSPLLYIDFHDSEFRM